MILLFCIALIAGIFDTLVGGGGLITLPAILMSGLPPHLALGTNKLQSSFGSGSASLHLLKREPHTLKSAWAGIIATAIGALLGVFAVLHIEAHDLNKWIPPLLFIILLYALFSKRIRINQEHPALINSRLGFITGGLTLGAYDAFLGPGTGSFWAAFLIVVLGFSIRKATIHAKIFNFTSNIVSLCIFIFANQVVYSIGLSMAAGQFIGGKIGAHLILKEGHRIIRPIYIIMVTIMLISLSYHTYLGGHL